MNNSAGIILSLISLIVFFYLCSPSTDPLPLIVDCCLGLPGRTTSILRLLRFYADFDFTMPGVSRQVLGLMVDQGTYSPADIDPFLQRGSNDVIM